MIKNRIADLRRAAKMSQSRLAEEIGATLSMVGKLERGERELNNSWLEKISQALNCKPVELYVDDKEIIDMGKIGAEGVLIANSHSLNLLDLEGFKEAGFDDPPMERLRSIETIAQSTIVSLPKGTKFLFSWQDSFEDPIVGCLAMISSPAVSVGDVLIGIALNGTSEGLYHIIPLGGGTPLTDVRIDAMVPLTQILLPINKH